LALPKQISDLIGSLSSKDLLGIDIGTHSVKVSAVSPLGKGNYKILGFASVAIGEAVIIEDEIQKIEDVVAALEAAVRLSGVKSNAACLGIYGPNTITKRMAVPDGSPEDVEDHIMWESEQYIPFGVDDSEIVHQILRENEGGGFDAIMAAARADMIESFMQVCVQAALQVRIVDMSVFAINNFFEALYFDDLERLSDVGAVIIDFGAQTTKAMVYKDNGPLVTKEINIGGVLVTEEIQRQMGISYEEAEDLKISGDDSGNVPEEFIEIFDAHIEAIIEEVKKTVSYYIQSGAEKITECYITGGSLYLSGLIQALEVALECEVIIMDPREKFKVAKKMDESMLELIGATGAVSLGLSMRCES
jgi:type IV pilus assembly protein PilM